MTNNDGNENIIGKNADGLIGVDVSSQFGSSVLNGSKFGSSVLRLAQPASLTWGFVGCSFKSLFNFGFGIQCQALVECF